MNQIQAKNNLSAVSLAFVELEINDLVKDRLIWQKWLSSSMNSREILPNVIHPLQTDIVKIARAGKDS